MKCVDCLFHWKEDWEEYPCCHWVERCPDDKAPCEYDEFDYTDDDEDETEEKW